MTCVHDHNQEKSQGLARLAAVLREDASLVRLAAYCELRDAGLRRQAFAELETFLEEAQAWSVPAQRGLAVRMLELRERYPQVHQFLSDPLRTRFVERVLEEWRAAEREAAVPVRRLALLRDERALLEEALRLNPSDDVVRAAIAESFLRFVDHATHHLFEGKFIGSEGDASEALAAARAVLAGAKDATAVQPQFRQLQELAALLDDWREYRRAPEGTFVEWCRARDRRHRWWNVYYYSG